MCTACDRATLCREACSLAGYAAARFGLKMLNMRPRYARPRPAEARSRLPSRLAPPATTARADAFDPPTPSLFFRSVECGLVLFAKPPAK